MKWPAEKESRKGLWANHNRKLSGETVPLPAGPKRRTNAVLERALNG